MAAMLVAIQSLGKDIATLSHEIWFAGLMGEEAGLHGSKALAARESFDFVIVGEPTGMCAVHAHKGSAWLHLTAKGRSVHASTPEAGINAIDKITEALACLRAVFSEKTSKVHDPALGHSTLSTGIITGGSKINIVPNHCEAMVDVRVVPGFEIKEVIDAVRERHPAVEIDCKFSPPLFTDPGHAIMSLLGSLGIPAATAPWFCDAASFGEKGTPAIALGPGSISQAHTADEFISIAELEAGAAGFEKFLRALK
jgi:acetylornithine deacetylase/succinyl-diaminopimelate desuccinylase-like protein